MRVITGRVLDDVGASADRTGEQIERAMAEAADKSMDELSRLKADELWRDINAEVDRAMGDVAQSFERTSDLARESLDSIHRAASDDMAPKVRSAADDAGDSLRRSMRSAADDSDRAIGGIGGSLRKLAGLAAATFATIGAFNFVRDSVGDAQEAEQAFAKLEQIVRTTGESAGFSADQLASIATDMSFRIGVDDEAIQNAQSVMLTFRSVTGDTFTEAMRLSADLSVVFGQDLSSSSRLLGKALENPAEGLSALTRIGIRFTEAEQAQIVAMVEAGNVADAQAAILEKVSGKVEGAAEASATGAQKMGVAFGEMKEALGGGIAGAIENIAPAIVSLMQTLAPLLSDVGERLGDVIGPMLDAFGPTLTVAVDIAGDVLENLGSIVGSLGPALTPIVQGFGALATAVSGGLAAAFTSLAPTIETIGRFLGQIGATLGGVIAQAFTALQPALDVFAQVLNDVLAVVLPIIAELFERLAPVISQFAAIFADVLVQVLPLVGDALIAIFTAIEPLIPAFIEIVEALLPFLPPILDLVTILLPPLVSLLELLSPIIATLATWLGDVLVVAIEAVHVAFGALATGATWLHQNVLAPLWEFIEPLASWLTGTFAVAWDKVSEAVGWLTLGASFLWHQILEPIASFMRETFATALDAVTDAWGWLIDKLETVVGWLKDIIKYAEKAIGWLDKINPFGGGIDLQALIDKKLEADAEKARGGAPSSSPTNVRRFAFGGMVDSPTIGIFEGKREVVVPLTRPGRAMELMQQSGLGQMWERERSGAGGPLVSFPDAVIQDATDVELVGQRVNVALMLRGA